MSLASQLAAPHVAVPMVETNTTQTVRQTIGDEVEKVELLPVPGLPGRVLVETARTLTATMVMLATRGEHAARLLGAVSQYVLRHAPCPVLVVPEASKGL